MFYGLKCHTANLVCTQAPVSGMSSYVLTHWFNQCTLEDQYKELSGPSTAALCHCLNFCF